MVSFNFGEMPVRVSDKDGNPWFVLSDICKVLDLANPSKTAQALDDDERSNLKLGRQGDGIIISEPGLYRLIMRSDKPQVHRNVARSKGWSVEIASTMATSAFVY